MSKKPKKTKFILAIDAICPGCGHNMHILHDTGKDFIMCDTRKCENYLKKFEPPTISLKTVKKAERTWI